MADPADKATDDILPEPSEQRVVILAQVSKIDRSDIKDCVRQIQKHPAQLNRIYLEHNHHESLAPAHMERLHSNLWTENKVEKWRSRNQATDAEVFLLSDQIIGIFGSSFGEFAQASVVRYLLWILHTLLFSYSLNWPWSVQGIRIWTWR